MRPSLLLALTFAFLPFSPASAHEPPLDPQLAEALVEAGANRAELVSAVEKLDAEGDPEMSAAIRFLVRNMTGKGYVVTDLRDKSGKLIEFDTLAYPNFKASQAALEALEKKHGELEFRRDRLVLDTQTITSEFLIRHTQQAFARWRSAPAKERVALSAFLNFVLPYRGSQEPAQNWIDPLQQRYADVRKELPADAGPHDLFRWISEDIHKRVKFNERYYLHPTDQGFTEMEESGQGRCEDITNMITFAARSVALATAADYTPAWGHRDNNHAWNVLLDAQGQGFAKGNAHAAKVYRKTFAIQRDALAYRLPEGRKAPNRFLASTSYIDVTDQYAATTDVPVKLDVQAVGAERFAYLCVFNGGEWVAIQWGAVQDGATTFAKMGRNLIYLPAVHDGTKLIPAGAPRLVLTDGTIRTLPGKAAGTDVVANSVAPKKKSPDTQAVTPQSFLNSGETYVLQRWSAGWETVKEVTAGDAPLLFDDLPIDGLYWLVKKESRRLERVFTIEDGRQRWW